MLTRVGIKEIMDLLWAERRDVQSWSWGCGSEKELLMRQENRALCELTEKGADLLQKTRRDCKL